MRWPRRRSSPWIRTAPQVEFSVARRRINLTASSGVGGRPGGLGTRGAHRTSRSSLGPTRFGILVCNRPRAISASTCESRFPRMSALQHGRPEYPGCRRAKLDSLIPVSSNSFSNGCTSRVRALPRPGLGVETDPLEGLPCSLKRSGVRARLLAQLTDRDCHSARWAHHSARDVHLWGCTLSYSPRVSCPRYRVLLGQRHRGRVRAPDGDLSI